MKTLYVLLCDKKEEADFAVAFLQKNGYQNIQVLQLGEYKVYEIEGNAPNYIFSGKYARMSENLFEVRAEK